MHKDFVPINNGAKNCNPYFCILKVGAVTFVIIDLIIFTQKDPSGYNSTLDEWYNHGLPLLPDVLLQTVDEA